MGLESASAVRNDYAVTIFGACNGLFLFAYKIQVGMILESQIIITGNKSLN